MDSIPEKKSKITSYKSPLILERMRRMIESDKVTYEILQYGPNFALKYTQYFLDSYNQIQTPVLYYFVDIAQIINAVLESKSPRYSDAIRSILKIMQKSSSRMDRYSDFVSVHGSRIIDGIQEKRNSRVNESAMLAYRPIVPYCGSLIKSEITDLHKRDYIEMDDLYQTRQIMDQTIEDCLQDHIIEIMSDTYDWMINTVHNLIQVVGKYNKLSDEETEFYRWILNYRIAVFIKFNMDKNAKAIFNILNDCNIIRNGGKIDVKKWVESFETS